MIRITESTSKKSVGQTSLFVSFEYDPKYVEIIKMSGDAIWHKDLKVWELPLNKLSFLIDNFTLLDDINVEFLSESDNDEQLDLSVEYKTEPFDYQLEDIKWLINNPNSLNLNMPGLGKTLELIYTAEELKAQKGVEHCLIICGINTLKTNWKKEIQLHSNLDCVIIGERINSKGNITYASVKERAEELYKPIKEFFVIINIESIRDQLVINAILNSKNKFDIIILDEIHKAKSPTSDQGKNLLKLVKVGKYHYGLTGTVIVNSPIDSYVPLKFIGKEKSNYSNFKNFYCIIDHVFGHQQIVGYKNMDLLKSEIDKYSIRRDKSILNLPPKIIVPEYIELTPMQLKFYNDLQKGIVEEADRVNIKTSSLLGLVTRLRQASTCPSVLSTASLGNSKIDRACELVNEIVSNNEKVIIFSTFKEPLYQLKELLSDFNPLICTGDQTDIQINESIDKFQNDNTSMVILCTTSKMGTGLTLHRAAYEIFLDSSWTARLEEQAEDRAYRIGQGKTLIVYKLIARGTIDERIQNILKRKRGISDYLVDDQKIESEELKELLGL